MRVFYAVENHYWEDLNLLAGLRQAGHDVVCHRPGHTFHEALGPEWTPADRERVSERLVAAVRSAHRHKPIDVLFAYVLKQLVYPEAIREIADLGIVTMNYWCNGAHQFYLVDEISPAFDLCVVTERSAMQAYLDVGARPFYLQMAANPAAYRPYPLPVEFDVTFVGQRYADRPEYVAYLLGHSVSVRVWGPGWTRDRTYGEKLASTGGLRFVLRHPRAGTQQAIDRWGSRARRTMALPPWAERRLARAAGPSLPYEDLIKMYSRSRISLGFSTTGDARYFDREKIRQIHLRDFEAPMSRALYFVEYQRELEDFYELDREIVCYRSREELLDKVVHYLGHPYDAARVRQAGYERAQRDHTWKRRFDELFAQL